MVRLVCDYHPQQLSIKGCMVEAIFLVRPDNALCDYHPQTTVIKQGCMVEAIFVESGQARYAHWVIVQFNYS